MKTTTSRAATGTVGAAIVGTVDTTAGTAPATRR